MKLGRVDTVGMGLLMNSMELSICQPNFAAFHSLCSLPRGEPITLQFCRPKTSVLSFPSLSLGNSTKTKFAQSAVGS